MRTKMPKLPTLCITGKLDSLRYDGPVPQTKKISHCQKFYWFGFIFLNWQSISCVENLPKYRKLFFSQNPNVMLKDSHNAVVEISLNPISSTFLLKSSDAHDNRSNWMSCADWEHKKVCRIFLMTLKWFITGALESAAERNEMGFTCLGWQSVPRIQTRLVHNAEGQST